MFFTQENILISQRNITRTIFPDLNNVNNIRDIDTTNVLQDKRNTELHRVLISYLWELI